MNTDEIIDQYELEQAKWVQVTVYKAPDGSIYREFCDQDGHEWVEEGE